MKRIYLNLKRFDISPRRGGVNRLAPMQDWGQVIVERTEAALRTFDNAEFTFFLPEAHLLRASAARCENSPIRLGSQGVHWADTAPGGNFGAFTTSRTGNAVAEMGCESTIIGHCEERADKEALLELGGVTGPLAAAAVNRVLNAEIRAAQAAGLSVLYCIGEKAEEQKNWQAVLGTQLDMGLFGVDKSRVVIGYEPVWSIGPGKVPADKPYIEKIAHFVKERTNGLDVVYGGGLKRENAAMLASIEALDGGLIALTRFSGDIGFYPDEYLEIVRNYLNE